MEFNSVYQGPEYERIKLLETEVKELRALSHEMADALVLMAKHLGIDPFVLKKNDANPVSSSDS